MKKLDKTGFSFIGFLFILLALVLLGFGGYWVYTRKHKTTPPVATTLPTTEPTTVPAISSTNDLDTALNALDKTNPDSGNSSDLTQVESDASGF